MDVIAVAELTRVAPPDVRKTAVSIPEAAAVLAITKPIVALSRLSFACVMLTNICAIPVTPFFRSILHSPCE